MLFVCHPKILRKHCLQFLLGVKMAPRETENNAYAKFWGDKQRALWYVMVFSGVVNYQFAILETRGELEPKRVPQLFLGSLLRTRRSAIGQIFFHVLSNSPRSLCES